MPASALLFGLLVLACDAKPEPAPAPATKPSVASSPAPEPSSAAASPKPPASSSVVRLMMQKNPVQRGGYISDAGRVVELRPQLLACAEKVTPEGGPPPVGTLHVTLGVNSKGNVQNVELKNKDELPDELLKCVESTCKALELAAPNPSKDDTSELPAGKVVDVRFTVMLKKPR